MIRVKNLYKSFGGIKALENLSFTLHPGKIHLLLGPNGAGKTTLNRILCASLYPDHGQIFWNETEVSNQTGILWNTGYLPDSDCLIEEICVLSFLSLCARLKTTSTQEEIHYFLHKFDLEEVKDKKIAHLSLGYRQRVALAQAFLGNPELILLDEPGNGLDPAQFYKLETILQEEKKNRIILISTHRIRESSSLCERILLLDQGKLLFEGPLQEASSALNSQKLKIVAKKKDIPQIIGFLDSRKFLFTSQHKDSEVDIYHSASGLSDPRKTTPSDSGSASSLAGQGYELSGLNPWGSSIENLSDHTTQNIEISLTSDSQSQQILQFLSANKIIPVKWQITAFDLEEIFFQYYHHKP